MKEFIEKLIGRLDEYYDENESETNSGFIEVCKDIVNELAEEYKGKLDDEWQIIYDKVCVLEKKYTNERNIESVKDCIRLENLLQYFKEELRGAEERENDFCEWKVDGVYLMCQHKTELFVSCLEDEKYRYEHCPICSKKIKAVE